MSNGSIWWIQNMVWLKILNSKTKLRDILLSTIRLHCLLIWSTLNQFTRQWLIKATATLTYFFPMCFFVCFVLFLLPPPTPTRMCYEGKSVLVWFLVFFSSLFQLLDSSYSKKTLLHGSFENTDNIREMKITYLYQLPTTVDP